MAKYKTGEDSPIPKFIYLKIRRRDGVQSLTGEHCTSYPQISMFCDLSQNYQHLFEI